MRHQTFLNLVLGSLVLGALAPASPVHAAPAAADSGLFRVYREGRAVGTEAFEYQVRGDSLVVTASTQQFYAAPEGQVDTLAKELAMVLRSDDFDPLSYESSQAFRGLKLHRGIKMNDTSMTVFFQVDTRGEGEARVRPPGRMFVLDPQMFVLYDLICRTLHGTTFESRPIILFALGRPDTVIEVTATRMGTETLRWGDRDVQAGKLRISDSQMEFDMWVSSRGALLRLEQRAYGILIERAPPAPSRPRRQPRSG